MLFDFNYFLRMFEIIASGFKNTLSLSVISLFFSVILGFVLAGASIETDFCSIHFVF